MTVERSARRAGRRARPRVSNPDRELVAAIRAELAAIEPTRACCRAAERAALGPAATGAAHSPAVARLAVRLGASPELAPRLGRSAGPASAFDWEAAAGHCRTAWLRGLFLAHGSLSLGFARTHLEFVVDPGEAPELGRRLAAVGFPAASRMRRGRAVLTWKSRDRVVAFLHAVGAGPSVLELEARGVARSLRGELNRLLNAETRNLERAVGASARQLEAIARLEADGRLAAEREVVRRVAAARVRAPDATLGDLAGDLGLTRSSVQRALERIERVADAGGAAHDAPFGPIRRARSTG